jgi:hypothetical protein
LPRNEKLRLERPPDRWTCGQRALISAQASMKSRA